MELGLVPLVGRAMLWDMFWSDCELSMTLGSLSADGWGSVPVLLVVWPEVFQHWSLQALGCGWVLVPKWGPLGELMPIFPEASATCVHAHTVSYSQAPPPQETLQDPLVGLAQVPMEVLLCAGSQCM